MTVLELKAKLRKLGLPVSGVKSVLIQRLADAEDAEDAEETKESPLLGLGPFYESFIHLWIVGHHGRDAYLFEGNQFADDVREEVLQKCKDMATDLKLTWIQESHFRYLFGFESVIKNFNHDNLGKLLGFSCPYDPSYMYDHLRVSMFISPKEIDEPVSIVWVCNQPKVDKELTDHLSKMKTRIRKSLKGIPSSVFYSVTVIPGKVSILDAMKSCDFKYLKRHQNHIENSLFYNGFVEDGHMNRWFQLTIQQQDCDALPVFVFLFDKCVLQDPWEFVREKLDIPFGLEGNQAILSLFQEWDKLLVDTFKGRSFDRNKAEKLLEQSLRRRK